MKHEHVTIHLHPNFLKKLEKIRREQHFENIEELIINAISEYYLKNK